MQEHVRRTIDDLEQALAQYADRHSSADAEYFKIVRELFPASLNFRPFETLCADLLANGRGDDFLRLSAAHTVLRAASSKAASARIALVVLRSLSDDASQ